MQKTTALADVRDETTDRVAHNLRDQMKALRWTGRSFALAFGLTPIYVQRRMSGEAEMSATDLKFFADKLEMRVQDFFKEPAPRGGNSGRLYGLSARRALTGEVHEPPHPAVKYRRSDNVTHITATTAHTPDRDRPAEVIPFPVGA